MKAAGGSLRLKMVCGEDALLRVIEEPMVNRPGLALTGFYRCFASRRLQAIGNAEWAYLASLGAEARADALAGLMERHKAWFFVYTSGHHAPRADVEIARKCGAVVMETPLATRVFSRMATYHLERLAAPRMAFYGTMLEVCGLGTLIEGDPGVGKSETALGLVRRGAALVADDLTCIRKDVASNMLYGSASESTAGFMEIRGIGIVHVPGIFGVNAVRGEKRVQLVITLKRLEDIEGTIDRIGGKRLARNILGVEVPNVVVPVSEGRDLVNLVEMAALQQKMLNLGNDSVAALSGRLRRRADAVCGRAGGMV